MSQITDAPRALPALAGRPSRQDWAELAAQHCAAGQAQTVERLDDLAAAAAQAPDLALSLALLVVAAVGLLGVGLAFAAAILHRAITRAAERERYWRDLATAQMRADQPREHRP